LLKYGHTATPAASAIRLVAPIALANTSVRAVNFRINRGSTKKTKEKDVCFAEHVAWNLWKEKNRRDILGKSNAGQWFDVIDQRRHRLFYSITFFSSALEITFYCFLEV
jgi:hypothetical protein